MAKAITDLVRTVAPTVDYPYGQYKDETGANDGTPANVDMFNDMAQFFQKLMDEAGVAPNGLRDNKTDGFQLFEAFLKGVKNYTVIQGMLTDTGFTELFNDTGETVTFTNVTTGVYDLDISGAIYTTGKTSVLTSNQNTAQGATTLTITGGEAVSTSKVKISCMAFLNMSSGGSTSAGVVVGGGLHPKPIYVEIRIHR